MILVVTLVAMMGLAKMLLNSFVMLSGSTMVTYTQKQTKELVSCYLKVLSESPLPPCLNNLLGEGADM